MLFRILRCIVILGVSRHRKVTSLSLNDLKQLKNNVEYLWSIERLRFCLHVMNISTLVNDNIFSGMHAKFNEATLQQDIDELIEWIFFNEYHLDRLCAMKGDANRMKNVQILLGCESEDSLTNEIVRRQIKVDLYFKKINELHE